MFVIVPSPAFLENKTRQSAGFYYLGTRREEIRKCKALTDKPFGVNIMLLNPNADEVADIVIEEGVRAVTTGAGNPARYMSRWKEAGVKVMPVVASSAMAVMMERAGAGAVYVEETTSDEKSGIIGMSQGSSGMNGQMLYCRGRNVKGETEPEINSSDLLVHMSGSEVYRFAVRQVPA